MIHISIQETHFLVRNNTMRQTFFFLEETEPILNLILTAIDWIFSISIYRDTNIFNFIVEFI